LPLRDQGCWAPQLIAPAELLAGKPRAVSWNSAAAFPVPALTAEQVVSEVLEAQAGDLLLVHGAGGVTGGLMVSLAAMRGATVIATASPSNHERLRRCGVQHLIDYHDARWLERSVKQQAAKVSRSLRTRSAAVRWRQSGSSATAVALPRLHRTHRTRRGDRRVVGLRSTGRNAASRIGGTARCRDARDFGWIRVSD
jgi:D-arabinose 1-dehydrogenase-like Zn-dependent alcohol dehydrogenase